MSAHKLRSTRVSPTPGDAKRLCDYLKRCGSATLAAMAEDLSARMGSPAAVHRAFGWLARRDFLVMTEERQREPRGKQVATYRLTDAGLAWDGTIVPAIRPQARWPRRCEAS